MQSLDRRRQSIFSTTQSLTSAEHVLGWQRIPTRNKAKVRPKTAPETQADDQPARPNVFHLFAAVIGLGVYVGLPVAGVIWLVVQISR